MAYAIRRPVRQAPPGNGGKLFDITPKTGVPNRLSATCCQADS